jgi:RHS repeat-associated protein
VRENSTSTNELAYYTYDTLSRRSSVCLGAYTATSCQTGTWTNRAGYGYETDGQLNALTQTLNGTTVSLGYGRNHSYQLTGLMASDPFYLPTPASASSTAYVPNALNQYGSIAGQTPMYDTNGNMLTRFPATGGQIYTYDSENRLTTAAVNGSSTVTVTYDYDALGRRTSKTVSGVSTSYLLDGDEEIAEYSGATVLRRFVTGPAVDDRIAHIEGSTLTNPAKTYYHTNHQGSVIAMTDGSGNVSQRIAYDEYGNGSPPTGEQYGYTGRRYDPETGLYYYRARYYVPGMGRFLQVDPVGYKDNLNLYTYVGNDPLDRTDPSGNAGELVAGGCAITAEVGCAPGAIIGGVIEGIVYVGSAAYVAYKAHQAIQNSSETKPSDKPAEVAPKAPPLPGGLVGDQSDPRAGQSSGKRHNSGPLTPENGGTGNANDDFDKLTGGTGTAPPNRAPGTVRGDNGVTIRPGKPGEGQRIDIPANGNKPPETLHYPPPPPPIPQF